MASEIRVNRLSNRSGLSTITFANGGVQFSGITTFANGDFRVGTGATIMNPSSNEMQFHTGGSNRLTINNSGVNLGTGNITAVDGTFTGNVSIAKTLTYEDVKNVDSVGVVTARTGVKVTGGDFTVGTAITASSVTGNVTQDVGITTFSGTSTWFKGLTANKDMYWSKSSGSLIFKDTAAAIFGNSSDLQISHNGSNSTILNTTGQLSIENSGSNISLKATDSNGDFILRVGGSTSSENAIVAVHHGEVVLSFNGNTKFETTNTGATITGRATAGGLTLNDGGASSPILSVRADDTNPWAFIFGNDTYNSSAGLYGLQNNGGDFLIRMRGNGEYKGINIERWDGTTNQSWVDLSSAGGVNVKYQGSTKLATNSSGVTVTGDLVVSANIDLADSTGGSNNRIQLGTGDDLQVYHDGSNGYVYNSGSGNLTLVGNGNNRVQIRAKNGENSITCNSDGNVELYHDGTKKLETTSAGTLTQGDVVITDAVYLSNASTISSRLTLNSENTSSWQGTRDLVAFDLIGNGADHRTGTLSIKIKRNPGDSSPTEMMRLDGVNNRTTLYTAGSERLRIDSSGNIGQSVTPSGWASAQAGDFYAYQIGTGMAIFGRGSGDEDRGGISCNYYNTAAAHKYIGNGHAGRIYFEDGSIVFSNAAQNSSGAGAAMTLDERLRIASNGRVQIANGGDLYVVGPSYNATLNGNILSFDRAGYSYIDQTSNSGALSFRVGASSAQILRLDTTSAIFPQGTLYLGTQNTSSGHLNAYETMTFNIDTDNDDSNRYFAFYKDGASGSGTELFHIGEDGAVKIPATNDLKLLLTGSSNPYIQFQESTTNKAYIQWNAGGYLHIVNQEDASALKLKDNFEFSDNNSDFHRVHHDDYFGHWDNNSTSVWVGTENASATVRDDEKNKFYRVEIGEVSWSGGSNTLDIVRANVHQNSSVHGNWWGSLDARIQFRTSHCGHGANYVRWVHHFSSSAPSGGFIGRTNAYLSCSESSRMIVWLRGQTSYQIRVNGRKATVWVSSGGSAQGGPDNTSEIKATALWDPRTTVDSGSVMAMGNDSYWYAPALRYGGQGATGYGTKCDAVAGGISVTGDVSATGNKPFRIPHPLVGLSTTKDLIHTAVEGPQSDLIYRGKVDLVNGTASVNIDTKTGMTEGTFVALNRDVQCFTTNETGWTNVKGSVSGNILTITAQDNGCTDTVSWMVVGERQDDKIKESLITDNDGHLIVELDQEPITEEDFGGTPLENQTDEQVSIMNSMMN